MATDQVLFGGGLILVLAAVLRCWRAACRSRHLIILLSAGFIAGPFTSDVNPELLLGAAFQPLMSLAVAVTFTTPGSDWSLASFAGTRRVVIRLITWGVPITWAFAAASAALLLGMSTGAALMTGAILVASGPTVIGPRGIVAAATASMSAQLAAKHVGGASTILPVTFLVIIAPAARYGLAACR